MRSYEIAVIPGDGIGVDVTRAALQVLEAAAGGSFDIKATEFPWSCEYYLESGAMMPPDGIETLGRFDAILLGARLIPPAQATQYVGCDCAQYRQYILGERFDATNQSEKHNCHDNSGNSNNLQSTIRIHELARKLSEIVPIFSYGYRDECETDDSYRHDAAKSNDSPLR